MSSCKARTLTTYFYYKSCHCLLLTKLEIATSVEYKRKPNKTSHVNQIPHLVTALNFTSIEDEVISCCNHWDLDPE